LVNEHYDEGKIIFQAATAIAPEDSAETIAAKVLALEHQYFAAVIEGLL
jgi:phosphoribosylglycinamide formyltransferase-1